MNSRWRFGDLRCLSKDEAGTNGVDEDSSSSSLVDSITAVSRSISGDSDISRARNAAKAAADPIAVSNHLRRVGQVAADVVFCVDDPENPALSATLSRLMRLMSQVLEHAAAPVVEF